MSIPTQSEGAASPWSKRAVPFAQRAVQQYFGCLAVKGELDALEDSFRKSEAAGNGLSARYEVALALALGQKHDLALDHLRALIAEDPNHINARRLAYRLLVYKAKQESRSQDWAGVADVVTEALKLSPPGTDPAIELAAFRNALPVGHIRTGNRAEACKLWEQQFQQNPGNAGLIHNLALIYYWWARGVSQNGAAPPATLWRIAIGYWVTLVNLEAFWREWRAARNQIWGFDFSAPELDAFRNGLVEEQLEQFFQAKADEHALKNEGSAARAYEECITSSILERKSAASWRDALSLLPADKSRAAILSLPGGVAFFQRFGLLPHIAIAVEQLGKIKGGKGSAVNLRIYFSESDLGSAAVLTEERNKPESAIQVLDLLPKPVRDSVDASYVRALALTRKAANLCGQGEVTAALDIWKSTCDLVSEAQKRGSKGNLFEDALTGVRDWVCDQARTAVQKEASRLKTSGNLREAISILESAKSFDKQEALLELQCVYMCDQGNEKLSNNDFDGSRKELNRVLALKPGYPRAVQVLSWVYNKEGCETQDSDRSISLFEKAVELQPDYTVAKRNLALELKGKSVTKFNALDQYTLRAGVAEPIRLLERAFNLIGSGLKPGALAAVQKLAVTDTNGAREAVNKLDNDAVHGDLVKRILLDLITMYQTRSRL